MNTKTKTKSKCSICDNEITGMGHNPEPVVKNNKPLTIKDRCCFDCNLSTVLPTRMFGSIDGQLAVETGGGFYE